MEMRRTLKDETRTQAVCSPMAPTSLVRAAAERARAPSEEWVASGQGPRRGRAATQSPAPPAAPRRALKPQPPPNAPHRQNAKKRMSLSEYQAALNDQAQISPVARAKLVSP
jgi:hypothetical protein